MTTSTKTPAFEALALERIGQVLRVTIDHPTSELNAVGPARAKQYLLTGDPLSVTEAERIGLVNRVVADDSLQDEALAFATRLADGAPLAVRYTKLSVNKLVKDALNVAFDVSTALELTTFKSEDHVEALSALREKRKPRLKGR